MPLGSVCGDREYSRGHEEEVSLPAMPLVTGASVSRPWFDTLEWASHPEEIMLVDRQPRFLGLGVALNAENVFEYE